MPDASPSDFYIVIHVWTTCDEHGVCVSKDSAEVIEVAWILINSKTLEEVPTSVFSRFSIFGKMLISLLCRSVEKKS
jgi:hypothetical protein